MSVTGEPGVGKSRLLFEFRRRLDALGVVCLEGRCTSHGAEIPYHLLRDLLRSAWQLPEDPAEILPALRARMESLGVYEPDAATIVAAWMAADVSLPAGVTAEALRGRAFEIVRDILFRLAGAVGCVLLLEDLHWIDQGSEAFLAGLIDQLATSRLFVVVSARSGHVVRTVDRSFISRLALPPLSRKDSETLARAVLPSAPSAQLVAHVVERAEGNPFFLEELLWAVGEGATASVPDTVTAALTVRMDRLATPERRVLEAAAVVGRHVPHAILAAMPTEAGDLSRALDSLVGLEFLYVQPGPVYVFKHALTQEVAYGRLGAPERRGLHAAAAKALEALAPHRLEDLAHHWDRADDHDNAIDYAVRFAEQATSRYALTEGVNAIRRALVHCDALPPGPDRDRRTVATAMQTALPLLLLGRTGEIGDVLRPYVPLVERLDDPRLSAPFFFSLTLAADHTADHDAAETFGARTIDEARRYGDRAMEGRALVMLSFSSMWASEHRRGLGRTRRAIECLDLPAEAFWRGHGLLTQAQLSLLVGELEAARASADALRGVGEAVGDRRLQAYGLVYGAMETMMRGDARAALRDARSALAVATDPLGQATIRGYLGEVAGQAGEFELARETLTAALEFMRAAHFRQLQAWDLVRLAEVELRAGDHDRARGLAQKARAISDAIGFPYVSARAEHVRGSVLFAAGALGEAITVLAGAATCFERIEAPYEWVRTTMALATVHVTAGDTKAASTLQRDAEERAGCMGAIVPPLDRRDVKGVG